MLRSCGLRSLTLSVALVVPIGCTGGGADSTSSAGDTPASIVPASWRTGGYVDDSSCVECHRDIAETFGHVAMAKTFAPASTDNLIEDFDKSHFFHGPSKTHYEMEIRGDDLVLLSYQLTQDGARTNELEQKVDWFVGSGNHVRGYLYQTPSHEMFELPIVWYSQEQSFGMAPGYDRPDHPGFTKPVQRDCFFCHNAYPDLREGGDRFGEPYVYPQVDGWGIGCQRCHGPAGEHVRIANDARAPMESIRGSIVNPARLPSKLADDICMQCHMQPTSARASILRRFDHGDFSFPAGEALADHILHVDFGDERERAERFEVNHHGYRFVQSRCFTESAGALRCVTCHDPHVKIPPEDLKAHHRDKCLSCHALEDCDLEQMAQHGDIPADDCIACHMPMRSPEDVPRVTVTDHYIRRFPLQDRSPWPSPPRSPGDVETIRVLPEEEAPGDRGDPIYRMIAAVKSKYAVDPGALEAAIEASGDAALDLPVYLADVLRSVGRITQARAAYARVVADRPDFVYARLGLAETLAASDRVAEAIEQYREAVRLDPTSPPARNGLGTSLARVGRGDEAIEHFREAIRLRPHYPAAHFNFAETLTRLGRIDDAIEHYRQALAIDPEIAGGARRLGELLRARGSVADAVRVWKHGLDVAPDARGIELLLAETLLTAPDDSVRDATEGVRYAERAMAKAGDDGRAAMVKAAALLLDHRPSEAIEAAEASIQVGADVADVMLILATAHHMLGRRDEGRRFYAQAAGEVGERLRGDPVQRAIARLALAAFDSGG